MLVETYADFVTAVAKFTDSYRAEMPITWRVGQGAFNLLVQIRPDIAEMVRGSDYDPFYDNSRLPLFYDFVMRNW